MTSECFLSREVECLWGFIAMGFERVIHVKHRTHPLSI